MKKKVLCFGELLLRLSPSADGAWIRDTSMNVYVGGAELNVAQALARWEIPVRYCTALPDNTVAEHIKRYLSSNCIETAVINNGDRIGLYYMAPGADLKNAGVIYDRSLSAFATLKKEMIDWEAIFEGIEWFHFSAIDPAISYELAEICEEALRFASKKNITISLDLNYRAKLWKYGKTPGEIMPGLAKYCDLIMGNIWAGETMLNIALDNELIRKDQKDAYLLQAFNYSGEVTRQYPKCKFVANTFRFNGSREREINYYAALCTGGKQYNIATYSSSAIVDKAGSGDCFMAGLIYSILHGHSAQATIDFAAAAAFSKFFIPGDSTNISCHQINQLIKHD